MKKFIKRLLIVLTLIIIATCLSSGGNACFFNEPNLSNYYRPNLVLEMRCNGDTLDYSGYQNNGVPIFETQYVTSINDRGLNFGGANFVEINDSASLNFGAGNFSMACWFKTASYQNNVIIDKRDISHNYQGYCLSLFCGIPLVQIGDGSIYYNFWSGYGAPTYNDGQWHFLGATVLRGGSSVTVTMYIDGAKVYQGSNGQVGNISNNSKLYIGRNKDDSGNFYGTLDDISIFNVALTDPCSHSLDYETQICRYNLYSSTALNLTFDTTASDNSRYQNTTTYYGSGPAYVPSMNLNGISFNGFQYIKVNNSDSLNFGTGDFTMACWFKTDSTLPINTILDKRNSFCQGYCLCLYNGIPLVQIGDESGYYNFWTGAGGPAFNNNQWHFITVTVDRDNPTGLKIYVDGSLIYTGNPTVKPGSFTNSADLLIGKHSSGYYFIGCLDEVYLINRALPGNLAEEYNPTSPTLVSAEPGDGRVTLLWNTVVGATSYQVKRSTTGSGQFTTIASGLTGTTYTDTNLTNGTIYYYEVTALNPGGESSPSAVKTATPREAVYPWVEMAKLPAKDGPLKAVTINGKIYAVVGNNWGNFTKVFEYNPSTDAWTQKADLPRQIGCDTGVVAFNNIFYWRTRHNISLRCHSGGIQPGNR